MLSVIVFVDEELELCKALMKNSYYRRDLAQSLLAKLMEKGIITDEETFTSVKSNVNLMNAISKSILLGLDSNIPSSKYGLKIVSDFDLYVNMATDTQLNDFLEGIKFDKNRPEYKTLKANRANLRRLWSA